MASNQHKILTRDVAFNQTLDTRNLVYCPLFTKHVRVAGCLGLGQFLLRAGRNQFGERFVIHFTVGYRWAALVHPF